MIIVAVNFMVDSNDEEIANATKEGHVMSNEKPAVAPRFPRVRYPMEGAYINNLPGLFKAEARWLQQFAVPEGQIHPGWTDHELWSFVVKADEESQEQQRQARYRRSRKSRS